MRGAGSLKCRRARAWWVVAAAAVVSLAALGLPSSGLAFTL
jgi:hypothetical protein